MDFNFEDFVSCSQITKSMSNLIAPKEVGTESEDVEMPFFDLLDVDNLMLRAPTRMKECGPSNNIVVMNKCAIVPHVSFDIPELRPVPNSVLLDIENGEKS